MSPAVKTALRVGRIGFLNSQPFYRGLQCAAADPDYYESYPSKINLAMRAGKIDIAPVSSLEYLNHQDRYLLLPGLAIAARDFSGSVILLSKKKIDSLDGARIALTRQSLSSAALLRVLLKFKYKFRNGLVSMNSDPERMLAAADAALVIGDDALHYEADRFLYKYDLSELWWDWTEKPFCFAVWAVRRAMAEKFPGEVRAFAAALQAARDRNLADIESLVRATTGMQFMDRGFPKIYGYFFNLVYSLDRDVLGGLELFYRFAHRLKLSPRPAKLEFFDS
jgi:chorismate dehydratase